jgi:hypothetical protein
VYCTLHCTFTVHFLSLIHMKVRDSDVLAWVMGTEEDEPSTGRVWAAGFNHVTARSHLACVLKLMNHLFNSLFLGGCGKPDN